MAKQKKHVKVVVTDEMIAAWANKYGKRFRAKLAKKAKGTEVKAKIPLEAYPEPKKMMTKAEVMKLQPGALIQVWWKDCPPTTEVLLGKPIKGKGDVTLSTLSPTKGVWHHVVSSQVIKVVKDSVFE